MKSAGRLPGNAGIHTGKKNPARDEKFQQEIKPIPREIKKIPCVDFS
jgi:hypothetical protein